MPTISSTTKEGEKLAAQAQAGAMVIAILLIVIMAFVGVSVIPVSPSIVVSFQVQTQQPQQISYNNPYQAIIVLGNVQYQRVSFLSYYSSQRDTLVESQVTGQSGSYRLGASVSYAGTVLTVGNYTSIGDGFYQLKIDYFPRTESSGTPYVVNMILYLQSSVPYSISVSVSPS